MNRIAMTLGLLVAVSAARAPVPAAAQTRVSVWLGFGVPQPYVSGYVVIGRPYGYYHAWRHYRRPPLVVLRRDVVVLPPRPIVVYRRPHRGHRQHRW